MNFIHLLEKCPQSPTMKHQALIKSDSDKIVCKHCGRTLDPLPIAPTVPKKVNED